MKTYEVWAEIAECEDGVQIDDVGNPAYLGVFPTIGELWDSNDNDEITETLVNDLKYEYGIEVSTHTEKGLRGKTYDVPDIEWKLSYCQGDWITTRNSCSMRKESRNDSKTTAAMFPLRS